MLILFSDTGGRPLFFNDLDLIQTNERNNVLDFWKDQSPFVISGFNVVDSTTLGPGKAIIDGDIVEKGSNTTVTSYPVYIQKAADTNTDTETYNDAASKNTKTQKTVDVVETQPASGEYITVTEAGGPQTTFSDILASKHTHTHFNSTSNPHQVTLEQARLVDNTMLGRVNINSDSLAFAIGGDIANIVSSDPVSVIRRDVSGSTGVNGHAWADESQIDRDGTIGYNSFDGRPEIIGSFSYDHISTFQARPVMKSSGTINRITGYNYVPRDVFNGGTISLLQGMRIKDFDSGNVTKHIGIHIEDELNGAGENWGLYVEGATDNRMGSLVIGGTTSPSNIFEVAGQADIERVNFGQYSSADGWGVLYQNASNEVVLTTQGSGQDDIALDSSGNVTVKSTFSLATGTSVNEIATTVSGTSTDDQLATAAGVYTLHNAHASSTSNPHSVTLEQARSQNNTFSGDINMGSNSILSALGLTGQANSNQAIGFNAGGDVLVEVDNGSGSPKTAITAKHSSGDVEFSGKTYRTGHSGYTQVGTSSLYYKILPDGTVLLKGSTTATSGNEATDPAPVTPNTNWTVMTSDVGIGEPVSVVIRSDGTMGLVGFNFSGGEIINLDGVYYDPNANV